LDWAQPGQKLIKAGVVSDTAMTRRMAEVRLMGAHP
jgi:hypothetical protein